MFWEILSNVFISLRNYMSKDLSDKVDVIPLTILIFLSYGIVAAMCLPFYGHGLQKLSSDVWKKMWLQCFLSLATSLLIAVCFAKTDNISLTSSLMALNIVLSFALESFLAGKIVAGPRKIAGMVAIILGTVMAAF